MEFIVEKFITWFKGKFKEWSADRVSGAISAYAEYLDIPQQVVSYWLAGKIKSPISLEHFTKLAAKYDDVYDAVGLPPPSKKFQDGILTLSPSRRQAFVDAMVEYNAAISKMGIAIDSPESQQILISILDKQGLNVG